MIKIATIAIIIFLIWLLFFKKNNRHSKDKRAKDSSSLDMIECESCRGYIIQDDAIFSNGKWYCSKECLVGKK